MGQQVSGTVHRTGGIRQLMSGANYHQQYSTVIAPTAGGETTKIKFAGDTPSEVPSEMSLSAPWR